MKKKITLIILFLITLVILVPSVNAENINYGDCINKYGSLKHTKSGSNYYRKEGTGNINYFNTKNNNTWSSKTVTLNFDVQTNKDYGIKTISYRLGSCTGEITGFSVPTTSSKGYQNMTFALTVNKGYVNDFTVWGTQSKFVGHSESILSIRKETINIKREYASGEKPVPVDEGSTGTTIAQKQDCKTFKDLIHKYWTWIIVLAPILTIIVISIDLLGAIISNDAEKLNKVGKNSIKRMAALVILLFLPYILDIIFGWFNFGFCF